MIKFVGAMTTGLLALVAVGYLATRSTEEQYEDRQNLSKYTKKYKASFLYYLKELFAPGPQEEDIHFA